MFQDRPGIQGSVQSLFRRVANVSCGNAPMIVVCTHDLSPAHIRYRVSEDAWTRLRLLPGEQIRISGSRATADCTISVYDGDTESVRAQESIMPDTEVRMAYNSCTFDPEWRAVLQGKCVIRDRGEHQLDVKSAIERMLVQRSRRLPSPAAVRRLLGLGMGYTPSGDDIIAGFAAASYARGALKHEVLREIALEATQRTTELSSSIIAAATEGFVSEDLRLVLQAMTCPPSLRSVRLVERYITETGHTSGRDTLYGVMLGAFS